MSTYMLEDIKKGRVTAQTLLEWKDKGLISLGEYITYVRFLTN